jgi:hypothetical protein
MGIRHRAMDGAPEKTPYHYLAPSHAINLLRRKDDRIKHLQCQAMNNLRSLTARNHQLEGWKRFALAISNTDIPRLNRLTVAALHDGAGVFGLLKKVDQAARHVYSPKGYQKADFERAFLMWKLGGRSAANIAYHTLGLPSIESARRHIRVSPITASSGVPTEAEMQSNLSICFPRCPSHIVARIIGMTMPIDEFKIQERLRWDPRTNMILGVCREHGTKCSLEFRSIVQANVLRDLLQKKGTASQPLRATHRRKKRPSSGEISPSCCADCDEMLTGKADSISCDGPGCDQQVRVISLGWIHL